MNDFATAGRDRGEEAAERRLHLSPFHRRSGAPQGSGEPSEASQLMPMEVATPTLEPHVSAFKSLQKSEQRCSEAKRASESREGNEAGPKRMLWHTGRVGALPERSKLYLW